MNPKFVVIADELIYKGNALTVPAYYHSAALALAESTRQGLRHGFLSDGNIQAVICESVNEAVEILAKDIGKMVAGWWGRWEGFKETDFEFSIRFADVKDGRLWLIPNASYCHNYPVKFPKKS